MRDNRIYLGHVLESIEAIENYYEGHAAPFELFKNDDRTRQATLHRLQTVGQSVKNTSPEILATISTDINWVAVGDFRNAVVHGYLSIDDDLVWNVIQNHLPMLKKTIEHYLEKKHD